MITTLCPRCAESIRLPINRVPDDAYALCPICRETFPASEVIDRLPPAVEFIGADGEPIQFEEQVPPPLPSHIPSHSEELEDTSVGANTNPFFDPTAMGTAAVGAVAASAAAVGFSQPSESEIEQLDEIPSDPELGGPELTDPELNTHTDDPGIVLEQEYVPDEEPTEGLQLEQFSESNEVSDETVDQQLQPVPENYLESAETDLAESPPEIDGVQEEVHENELQEDSEETWTNDDVPSFESAPTTVEETVSEVDSNANTLLSDTWTESTDASSEQTEVPGTEYDSDIDAELSDDDTDHGMETIVDQPVSQQELSNTDNSIEDENQAADTIEFAPMQPSGTLTVEEDPLDLEEEADDDIPDRPSGFNQDVPPMKVTASSRPEPKQGSAFRTLMGIAIGPLLALPLAAIVLIAIGKAPNLGFWPFDGSYGAGGNKTVVAANDSPGETQSVSNAIDTDTALSELGPTTGMNSPEQTMDVNTVDSRDNTFLPKSDNDTTGSLGDLLPEANGKSEVSVPDSVGGSEILPPVRPQEMEPSDDSGDSAPAQSKPALADNGLFAPVDIPGGEAIAPPAKPPENVQIDTEDIDMNAKLRELEKIENTVYPPPVTPLPAAPRVAMELPDTQLKSDTKLILPPIEEMDHRANKPKTADPPAINSLRATDSPELVSAVAKAKRALNELALARATDSMTARVVANAYSRVGQVGLETANPSSESIRSLLSTFAKPENMKLFNGTTILEWLKYDSRPHSGVLLIGTPGKGPRGQTITLSTGEKLTVRLHDNQQLPAGQQIVAVGRIVERGANSYFQLNGAMPVH